MSTRSRPLDSRKCPRAPYSSGHSRVNVRSCKACAINFKLGRDAKRGKKLCTYTTSCIRKKVDNRAYCSKHLIEKREKQRERRSICASILLQPCQSRVRLQEAAVQLIDERTTPAVSSTPAARHRSSAPLQDASAHVRIDSRESRITTRSRTRKVREDRASRGVPDEASFFAVGQGWRTVLTRNAERDR
jgi:hypothetical protein